MVDVIGDLKAKARVLHAQVKQQEPAAMARVRALPDLRGAPEDALAITVKRRHCLAVIARELGFSGWPHAVSVLTGACPDDFGTLLYPARCSGHWNIWSASYDEARAIRAEHGGYLLPYKRHFFVADRHFIESLGLDPDDDDWERIGRDWVRPAQPDARARLYARLIRDSLSARAARSSPAC